MAKPPVLKPREIAGILQKLGFVEVRQRGSQKQYRHVDGRCTTLPFHQGRHISPILFTTNRQRHWFDGGRTNSK